MLDRTAKQALSFVVFVVFAALSCATATRADERYGRRFRHCHGCLRCDCPGRNRQADERDDQAGSRNEKRQRGTVQFYRRAPRYLHVEARAHRLQGYRTHGYRGFRQREGRAEHPDAGTRIGGGDRDRGRGGRPRRNRKLRRIRRCHHQSGRKPHRARPRGGLHAADDCGRDLSGRSGFARRAIRYRHAVDPGRQRQHEHPGRRWRNQQRHGNAERVLERHPNGCHR